MKLVKVSYIIDDDIEECQVDIEHLLKGRFEVPLTKKVQLHSIKTRRLRELWKLSEDHYIAAETKEEIPNCLEKL